MNRNSEYEKMPKNLKGLYLSDKEQHDLNKLKWVVTEKIHGANFSFVYEDYELRYAKRKDYLTWTDDFFGFQAVVAEIEGRGTGLFEQLRLDIPARRYIIYGELFGGKYPHPEVAPDEHVQAIQTGVYYCPSVRFCARSEELSFLVGEMANYITKNRLDSALSKIGRLDFTTLNQTPA